MRYILPAILLFGSTGPALAQATYVSPALPSMSAPAPAPVAPKPVATPAAPPANPNIPASIPTNGIWRSDSGLAEAEKLLVERKYSEALSLLDVVISRNMRNADAHVDSAMAWINLGNIEKAKSSAENALMIDKNHLGAYVVSGMIALLQNEPEEAAEYLGILRILCRGESCTEYQTLVRMIRETKIKEDD